MMGIAMKDKSQGDKIFSPKGGFVLKPLFLAWCLLVTSLSVHGENISLSEDFPRDLSRWEVLTLKPDGPAEISPNQFSLELENQSLEIEASLPQHAMSITFLLNSPLSLDDLGVLKQFTLQNSSATGLGLITLIFEDPQGWPRFFPIILEDDLLGRSFVWTNGDYIPEVLLREYRPNALVRDFTRWRFLGIDLMPRGDRRDVRLRTEGIAITFDLSDSALERIWLEESY
jgi:hypothetical protein